MQKYVKKSANVKTVQPSVAPASPTLGDAVKELFRSVERKKFVVPTTSTFKKGQEAEITYEDLMRLHMSGKAKNEQVFNLQVSKDAMLCRGYPVYQLCWNEKHTKVEGIWLEDGIAVASFEMKKNEKGMPCLQFHNQFTSVKRLAITVAQELGLEVQKALLQDEGVYEALSVKAKA